jgi:hypothetical protein
MTDPREAIIAGLRTHYGPGASIDYEATAAECILLQLSARGFAVVPVEATEEMRAAAWAAFEVRERASDNIKRIWSAMIAAAAQAKGE